MATFTGTNGADTIAYYGVSSGVISSDPVTAPSPFDYVYDELYGLEGRDYLDGGYGKDFMAGGDGSDTYVVDDEDDIVKEVSDADGGVDTVITTVSHKLAAGVENLTLMEWFGNINGTGNALNNVIRGNEGNNILRGGKGADKLTGGDGADIFDFNSVSESNSAAKDRIMDFRTGGNKLNGDKIDLTGIDADTSKDGNQAFKWGGETLHGRGYIWVDDASNGDTIVRGNVDKDATAEFVLVVKDGFGVDAEDWHSYDFYK